MGHVIDVQKWKRRDHFRMYRAYARPFFGVCVKKEKTLGFDSRHSRMP